MKNVSMKVQFADTTTITYKGADNAKLVSMVAEACAKGKAVVIDVPTVGEVKLVGATQYQAWPKGVKDPFAAVQGQTLDCAVSVR